MKNKIRLKKETIKMIMVRFGTCKNVSECCNLSQVTVAKALNGYPIGHKTRTSIINLLDDVFVNHDIDPDDLFELSTEE